ncbi:MAG: hypothetical protein HY791_11035 [Deltaproteobacteria bacterium]|nr:hypothetical protein [Deltaproteobacteria bacterium]
MHSTTDGTWLGHRLAGVHTFVREREPSESGVWLGLHHVTVVDFGVAKILKSDSGAPTG